MNQSDDTGSNKTVCWKLNPSSNEHVKFHFETEDLHLAKIIAHK